MENTIEIRVVGKAMSGKTTISQEIVDALRIMGFDVQWDVSPDYKYESKARRSGIERHKRLVSIQARKTKIVLKEVQAAREHIFK